MVPSYGRGELLHLELLMEALARAEAPQGIPGTPRALDEGPRRPGAADESPAAIADAAPSRSVMRLSGTLDLHDKLPVLPEASWGSDAGGAADRAEVARKWFAWYCKRLRARIAAAYPFEMLAKQGIRGKISFRLELEPDGRVRQLTVVESDHPLMTEALGLAIKRASPLPGYSELGLDRMPPLNLTITQ
jgi:outer membrane biosynthesis protein TonB